MIDLNEEKQYFILIDGQGGRFGEDRIFEGIQELVEQFQTWAHIDGYQNPTLKGWNLMECVAHWTMTLKIYHGGDFMEIDPTFHKDVYNFIIK